MLWKFLGDPESNPLANNHAERQIRRCVVYRKNSYFTQSERENITGANNFFIFNMGKKELNRFQNLLSLVP
jgi:hypothetical protein